MIDARLRIPGHDTHDTNQRYRDIEAIRIDPSVAPSRSGPAMTKTLSIYAAQILLGVVAIATGYAKLIGTGLMVQQFQALGLGHTFLTVAGMAEIAAGLCLLLPRGGILGAVLLACVMVGALGVTIGHVASAVAAPVNAPAFTSTSFQAKSSQGSGMIRIVRPRAEFDI
jgi:uncharacterized membrane protein YphA (DoxX/SURF4 family)